jgi:hypothetical protein
MVPIILNATQGLWHMWTVMQTGETGPIAKNMFFKFMITTSTLLMGLSLDLIFDLIHVAFNGQGATMTRQDGKLIYYPHLVNLLRIFAGFIPAAILANRKYGHLWLKFGKEIYKAVASSKASKLTSILDPIQKVDL